jgi:hypothetical protein
MHLEVFVGAVAEELRAAKPEVGEPGDVLLGRRGGCPMEVDRGHASSLFHALFPVFRSVSFIAPSMGVMIVLM